MRSKTIHSSVKRKLMWREKEKTRREDGGVLQGQHTRDNRARVSSASTK